MTLLSIAGNGAAVEASVSQPLMPWLLDGPARCDGNHCHCCLLMFDG
jgi:hypothetical protein